MSLLDSAASSATNIISSQVSNLIGGATKEISAGARGLFSANLINNLTKIENDAINFPLDLMERSDITQFTYFRVKDVAQKSADGSIEETFLGGIYLPLPKELTVPYKSNWSSVEGGAGGTAGAQAAIKDMFDSGGVDWGGIGGGLKDSGSYAGASALYTAAEGAGLRAGAEHATGKVLNPMKLLNWQAPDFRSFSFTYDLIPHSAKESEELNKIIYYFKKYIHTPSAPGSITLQYPPLWDIHFVDKANMNGSGNKYLFKIMESAITEVSVDYTVNGNVFHRDTKAPNGVKLSISFTENKILTQSDFPSYNDVTP